MRWRTASVSVLKNGFEIIKRESSLDSVSWLQRRSKDVYVEKAKMENYRCRSAFKLIEIDDKYKIIKPGQWVIDIGAAPGSWTQVLVERTNATKKDPDKPKGMVISIDKTPMYAVEGAHILHRMDFTAPDAQKKINELLHGSKLDFVFSDMAPMATGVKSMDSEIICRLALSVLKFAVENLHKNGGCVIKVWQGRHESVAAFMKKFFDNFNYVKPSSSYSESSEIFLLGRNFKGVQKM